MAEIMIRAYVKEDKNDIMDLILDIQRNEFEIPISKDDQPDLSDIPNFYQSGNGNFWVAVNAKNQIIGTIALIDIGNQQGALRKMFVKKAYRGRTYNVANLLLQKLVEWAQQRNMNAIYLGTTGKFLAAHRFYEKNGFLQIDKNALPNTFPIMKVDTKFYQMAI
ncbi:MAG: GCN5-related N-acetyltransferase [Firmicutes bacterium]|nr:GCN5-related N-acetyltransferase [Bacillota bacterium]